MFESKIKIDANNLAIGMYICELDIPWLDSPFLFQGFPLHCEEDIEDVKKVCRYVYVDPEQSDRSIRANLQLLASQSSSQEKRKYATVTEKKFSSSSYDYREHLRLARKIYSNTRNYLRKSHDDVRHNKGVDVSRAKNLVHELADNIMVSPNAMMWLTHLKKRHEYTLTHSINVCILALTFGRYLKLDKSQLELLGLGALLHDIGKLRIPPEILDKPGKLTDAEFEIMKSHPVEGHKILKTDGNMPLDALDIVLHHHERINGKGYPAQLNKEQITRLTKLTSIVDVYDAITSDRCYHDGISPYKALQNIYSWTSGHFDKEYVEEFMGCMGIYPVGTIVKLNDGQIAVVIATTKSTRLRPMVLLVKNQQGQFYKQRRIYNLSSQEWDHKDTRLEISAAIEPKDSDISVMKILEQESFSPQASQAENFDELSNLLN